MSPHFAQQARARGVHGRYVGAAGRHAPGVERQPVAQLVSEPARRNAGPRSSNVYGSPERIGAGVLPARDDLSNVAILPRRVGDPGRLLRNDQATVYVEPQSVNKGLSVGYARVFKQPSLGHWRDLVVNRAQRDHHQHESPRCAGPV